MNRPAARLQYYTAIAAFLTLFSTDSVKYSESQQVQLINQAEQLTVALSYNTQEPYHSVAACRELAETQDKCNEQ